jgi:hypothetical protein
MPVELKQGSTPTVMIGPFLLPADGNTPVAGLTTSDSLIFLSKNGANTAVKHDTTDLAIDGGTGAALCHYKVVLDATDTDTLGNLRVMTHVSATHLPVWQDFAIVTADYWDSKYAAVVLGQAGAQAAIVANNLDHLCKTATAAADMTTEITDNTILSRVLGNGDTSTFVPSTDGLHAMAYDMLNFATLDEVGVALRDTPIGTAAADSVGAAIANALADTDELQAEWVDGGRLDLILDIIAADTTTDIPATITTMQGNVTSILEDTGTTIPATLAGAATTDDVAVAVRDKAIAGAAASSVGAAIASILDDTGTAGVVLAADAITAAKIADNAIAAEHLAAGAIDIATFAADVGTTALASNPLALAAAKGAHDAPVANYVIASTFGKYLGGAPAGVTLAADVADLHTDIGALATTADMAAAVRDVAITGAAADSVGAAIASTLADTNELQTNQGNWLTATGFALATELAKVPKSDSNVTWNNTALASINAEVDTALNTAIPGSPTGDSINERIATMDGTGVNVYTVTNGAITANAIANAAIDNATFAADVGTTALATNIIATAAAKAWDAAVADHSTAVTFGKYLGGAPAGVTLAADIATIDANVDTITADTTKMRKIMTNSTVEDPATETLTVYDDDDSVYGTFTWDEVTKTRSDFIVSA